MNRLKDRVAIITGGANGIGLATAELFLKEAAKVVIVDLDKEALEKANTQLDHENLAYCVADVAKTKDTYTYIDFTLKKFGKINIFFANAGIEGTSKPIADYPENIFDQVIAVNLKGVWNGCKYVIPKMEEGGSVMITSSVAGLKGFAGLGAYVASKHAVIGLMRVAALENAGRKVRVNTINPGPVNNDMMRRIEKDMSPENPDEVMKGFESSVPFGRYAESSEIADMALFLASDDSKYVTGCMHVVDGGMLTA
ncbi:SDR family oxidoreductase [Muricauda sp. JGD-17]|uniref:SDR family oxidoreductase n=1 Tax=Flagellimonas ochracea TaxID=2696472 RepID=A0A964TBT0_9FLAO|nr:SDR family NAD(P)-dependent oxidoreductase [Allomuricauda ochracea]NAY91349.1 SDR family oxidoreductase [Allomuricauda ochracea]